MNTQRTPGKTRQMYPLHRLSPKMRKDVPLTVDWEENKRTNTNRKKTAVLQWPRKIKQSPS